MTRHTPAPALIGVPLGLAVLAALVVFSLVLDEGGSGDIELPESLPGGWHSVTQVPDSVDDPERAQDYAERQSEAIAYVEERLAEAYDDETAFAAYTNDELERFVTVTAFAAPGGSFAPPNGIADPEQLGLARSPVELVRERDAVCTLQWEQLRAGTELDAGEPPLATTCQLSAAGRTYMLSGSALMLDDAVELVEAVAAAAS